MPALWLRYVGAIVVLAGTMAAQAQLPARTMAAGVDTDLRVPSPQFVRLAALGFDEVAADYYWLRALQIVGGEHGRTEQHAPVLARLLNVVTELDPWVDHPYRFAAVWLTDSPASVRAANRILERGIAYHPTDWRNRFYLSFNHFFYLVDAEAAARELEATVDLPGAPRYLKRLLARLRSESGDLEVASAYLLQQVRLTEDPYRRAEYEKALDEVETERRARVLDHARATYRERHGTDIDRVEDLVRGPGAVLSALPPEPHGWEWMINEQSGEIMSSYLRNRYRINVHPLDRERQEQWNLREPQPIAADGERS